jgi:regulator of RNase E activity RraA
VNAAEKKRLTGRIAAENIKLMAVPRPPQGAVERLAALGDCTGLISYTMDELGIPCGVIGASVLKPTMAGRTIVGPALTVRNILQRINPIEGARQHVNRMAEFEAHNLAQKGDVLVIQGVPDVAHSRALDYPVWASDITPVTGKWRIETVEINGPVQIGEVRVAAGDLVVADDTGVCFIPRDVVLEVLDAAEQKAKAEAVRCKAIDDGVPVPDIARATYGEK